MVSRLLVACCRRRTHADLALFTTRTAHDSNLAPPERRYELVASTVVELGKRFLSSEVAFPVGECLCSSFLLRTQADHALADMLTDELESYAFGVRHEQTVPIGWAPLTLLSVGALPEMIYDVLLGALMSKVSIISSSTLLTFSLTRCSTASPMEHGRRRALPARRHFRSAAHVARRAARRRRRPATALSADAAPPLPGQAHRRRPYVVCAQRAGLAARLAGRRDALERAGGRATRV